MSAKRKKIVNEKKDMVYNLFRMKKRGEDLPKQNFVPLATYFDPKQNFGPLCCAWKINFSPHWWTKDEFRLATYQMLIHLVVG